jgi:hypothetical protein
VLQIEKSPLALSCGAMLCLLNKEGPWAGFVSDSMAGEKCQYRSWKLHVRFFST